ncbi:MAG: hypothetical protein J7J91_08950 [Deltaproteobacteria bacterium]|nr:hypothetical protein [Deltaproteobacteria bacterium]
MVTAKEVGIYAAGIAGGALLNEISKRVSAATGLPVEWANIGVGGLALVGAERVTTNPDYREIIKLAGATTAVGTVVSMVMRALMPTAAARVRVVPAATKVVKEEEELVKVD